MVKCLQTGCDAIALSGTYYCAVDLVRDENESMFRLYLLHTLQRLEMVVERCDARGR